MYNNKLKYKDYNYTVNNGNATITGYYGMDDNHVIPGEIEGSKVTSIGSGAFAGCDRLTSVNIPNTVTSIGGGAFTLCKNLLSINIPEGVTSIGVFAFKGCYNLTSINIPKSVTFIGEGVFQMDNNPPKKIGGKLIYADYKNLDVTLTVTNGSFAEQYAIDNGLLYI